MLAVKEEKLRKFKEMVQERRRQHELKNQSEQPQETQDRETQKQLEEN